MNDCPTCGETFESRRGLGVHHSLVHDHRLPNRTGDRCGDRFFANYEKRYCSDECLDSAVSFEGEDNPNYDGGKTETHCRICDSAFYYYPSEKRGLYCSECIQNERWRHEPDVTGPRNPRWNGGKRELKCRKCGVIVRRHPWNITSKHVFCSDNCQYEWLSEAFTGKGHPNWKGGTQANYGRGWHRVRRLALERDDHCCVVCGATKAELGRNPDVHHIVPVRAFVEMPVMTERDAHYLENLVSLCVDCHRKAEFGHVSRERLRAVV